MRIMLPNKPMRLAMAFAGGAYMVNRAVYTRECDNAHVATSRDVCASRDRQSFNH